MTNSYIFITLNKSLLFEEKKTHIKKIISLSYISRLTFSTKFTARTESIF